MRTSNGLNVPAGWGTEPPNTRRACPVCGRSKRTYISPAKVRLVEAHNRPQELALCPGSHREPS